MKAETTQNPPPLEDLFKAFTLTTFSLITLSIFLFLFSSSSSSPFSLNGPTFTTTFPSPTVPVLEKMGIVDENGAMADEFIVGSFDPKPVTHEILPDLTTNRVKDGNIAKSRVVVVEKFKVCDQSMVNYIPCLENVDVIRGLNATERGQKFERHCPEMGKGLDCLVPVPKGYRSPVPWPQSRDEVWFNNVPHTQLVEDKGGQNSISRKEDKFVFPGDGTQYLNQISQMVPDIKFGQVTRVVLDIGSGVASFGAFLMQRNVSMLSIAPEDVHENQIQFALERGVPAMVTGFSNHRLLYPSQAFDLIHCSGCRVNWTRDDGILLLEVNRMLRAGGYFVWAAQPVYKHEEMENLTSRICWELVKKEGDIAIWKKPLNNSCYLNRQTGAQPPLCDQTDDPNNVWYIDLKACITQLPDIGYEANVSTWPERLHHLPDRLQTIQMDAYASRKDIVKADSKYWNKVIQIYINGFRWRELKIRNVMDMRAGFGGFAAALHDFNFNCWVMNVVPVSGFNTLPLIYDRGLIGVMHDWCEAFDTYPRTYDLLHASGLFSIERKRCNVSTIMLEMDRILRPDGMVYVQDLISVINELQEVATAMRWVCLLQDSEGGPHSSWKVLRCSKPK